MDRLARDHLLAMAVILAVAVVAALLLPDGGGRSTLESVRHGGNLRAGYAIEPPYAYLSPTQRVTGEAPEVLRAVMGKLGTGEIDWVQADFPTLIQDLLAGRIDVIAAGMFITPEREKRVIFSVPTARVCPGLLVRAGVPDAPQGYADFARRDGLVLGVLQGAVEGEQALAAGVPRERLREFPDLETALFAMRHGSIQAIALSAPTLRRVVAQQPKPVFELRALAGGGQAGLPAFAFRPEDRALRDAVNGVLPGYLATSAHRNLVERFGFTEAEVDGRGDAAGGQECGK